MQSTYGYEYQGDNLLLARVNLLLTYAEHLQACLLYTSNKPNYGFDAQNEVFVEDMIAAGIVDPTKVTRSALENAASVAEMVLTTESLVADLPEPPAAPAAGGDMGGMGGMY